MIFKPCHRKARQLLECLLIPFLLTGFPLVRGAAAGEGEDARLVPEAFVSESRPEENVDSVALYRVDADTTWAIVTAKATDYLVVFDAATGKRLKTVGSPGTGPGEFHRPNGILAIDDLLLVVERDNHRVQVMRLPDFQTLGFIGVLELKRPYGLSCFRDSRGIYQLYVTDNYLSPNNHPPPDFYRERVKWFQFRIENDAPAANLVRAFGEPEGPGRLSKVESILADPDLNRILICNEAGPGKGVKIYSLDGRFQGRQLTGPGFKGEPEGLGMYGETHNGYLITTDQRTDITVFHLYRRDTLAYAGGFHGRKTANTDGIGISTQDVVGFPHGGLWAIHDDQALAGFRWIDIEKSVE